MNCNYRIMEYENWKEIFHHIVKFIYHARVHMYGEVGLAPSTENGWERVTCRLASNNLWTRRKIRKGLWSSYSVILLYIKFALVDIKENRRSRHISVYPSSVWIPPVLSSSIFSCHSFPPTITCAFSLMPLALVLLARVAVSQMRWLSLTEIFKSLHVYQHLTPAIEDVAMHQ